MAGRGTQTKTRFILRHASCGGYCDITSVKQYCTVKSAQPVQCQVEFIYIMVDTIIITHDES